MANYLTKSKYLSGLQCHKRLWNEVKHPNRAADTSISQKRKFDQSKEVGILARDHFTNGVLIDAIDPLVSVEQTAEAIERGDSCIFEASFIFNDVLVRCDIIQKDSNSWNIIEVKASTVNQTVKDSRIVKVEYLHDLAIQKYVLAGHGLSISKTKLMLIDSKECVYPDLGNLFIIEDATEQVNQLMGDVPSNVETFKTIINGNDEPQVLIGDQCKKPYTCPFKETYCWMDVPQKSIFTIPGLRWNKKGELIERGIFSLEDVPDDFALSEKQRTYVNSVIDEQPVIDIPAVQRLLSDLEYPVHFFDFETDNPPIPRFEEVRPCQHFPFQYSCHVLKSDGSATHYEYLHTDTSDPRRPLLESLFNHISPSGSVVVFNATFERLRLNELTVSFPEYSSELESIINRLWDQLDIFKNHYMHPDFCGSNSLKDVLPVLVPSLSFKNLDVVHDGLEAQALWDLMINTTSESKQSDMIEHLKEYCKLDTLAMLEIHKVLCGL
ncbi:DUF2779 domain-containing protein [Candidatus Poribacteria bacterium]|nr:DUF2779 domain-containing protein [Candidatus Poribacteria bacterium]MYB66248.1 DUF2779 domain-containing protein [Candidatus Poribacteria bacterium]MYF54980.1 DUF2779 domain-containing protein [Candidatus Poribacteria bacterium]MYI94973.1 DUF2779 domain-containing protein [Candidatus Poribacteria bacterium]